MSVPLKSLVENVVIAKTQTSVRLVDILIYRVLVWVLSGHRIICHRASKVICSTQSCSPIPVAFELTIILKPPVRSNVVVRANISAPVQINDGFIIVMGVKLAFF